MDLKLESWHLEGHEMTVRKQEAAAASVSLSITLPQGSRVVHHVRGHPRLPRLHRLQRLHHQEVGHDFAEVPLHIQVRGGLICRVTQRSPSFRRRGHKGKIHKLLVTDDFVFSTSADKTARVWYNDPKDRKPCIRIFKVGRKHLVLLKLLSLSLMLLLLSFLQFFVDALLSFLLHHYYCAGPRHGGVPLGVPAGHGRRG